MRNPRSTAPSVATRALLLAAALTILNVLLGLDRWIVDTRALTILAPTLETGVALSLMLLAARADSRRMRVVHLSLAVVLAILALFGIGEGFYQSIFRKGFVPWSDLSFLPALLNMVLHTAIFERPVMVAAPLALLAAATTAALYGLLRWIDTLIRAVPPAVHIAAGSVLIVLAAALLTGGTRMPLVVRAVRQITPPGSQAATGAMTPGRAVGVVRPTATQYAFPALRDRNIHLFIVESYGRTILADEAHRSLIMPTYATLESRLREAGYVVYSGFMDSPAFGGRSWFADSTILTGTFIDSQHAYDEMVASAARNLTHILGEAGYYRILAAPGTYEADAAWRAFYQFDRYLFRYDFDYQGPFISFGAMPDQFLVYRTHELIAGISKPLFVNYVLVSSHVPFDRLPQYVDDWTELGDGSIFNTLELRTFDNNWLSGDEYPEGYVASIAYSLRSVVTYITDIVADDSLFILIGDHQPRTPISGPDSTFAVPLHVISRNRRLIEEFSYFGLNPGIVPAAPPPYAGMDSLLAMVLDAASGRVEYYRQIAR